MTFRVGQKVVCIEAGWPHQGLQTLEGVPCQLTKGTIYTITGYAVPTTGRSINGNLGIVQGVLVDGASNITPIDFVDMGFDPYRFRALLKRQTDISIFQELLLNPSKQLEGVE